VHFQFGTIGALPENFGVHIFDNGANRFLTKGSISVKAHSTVSRWLTVGDAALRDRFMAGTGLFHYRLHRVYPNPARSMVNICYSVPLGAEERLSIMIFDLRGRKVWEKGITRLLSPGTHITTWNGRSQNGAAVSAGMYTVRFSVIGTAGQTLRRFQQYITFLP
jgi:hypothetical protein